MGLKPTDIYYDAFSYEFLTTPDVPVTLLPGTPHRALYSANNSPFCNHKLSESPILPQLRDYMSSYRFHDHPAVAPISQARYASFIALFTPFQLSVKPDETSRTSAITNEHDWYH
jgi:hypothetical protein